MKQTENLNNEADRNLLNNEADRKLLNNEADRTLTFIPQMCLHDISCNSHV